MRQHYTPNIHKFCGGAKTASKAQRQEKRGNSSGGKWEKGRCFLWQQRIKGANFFFVPSKDARIFQHVPEMASHGSWKDLSSKTGQRNNRKAADDKTGKSLDRKWERKWQGELISWIYYSFPTRLLPEQGTIFWARKRRAGGENPEFWNRPFEETKYTVAKKRKRQSKNKRANGSRKANGEVHFYVFIKIFMKYGTERNSD